MPGYNHRGGYARNKDLTGMRFGRLTVISLAEPYRDREHGIKPSVARERFIHGWKVEDIVQMERM